MRRLFSVGNSVTLFFTLLLSVSVWVMFSFDERVKTPTFAPNTLPKIEISDFTIFEIDESRLITQLHAQNGKQFDTPKKQTIEELTDITMHRQSDAFDVLKAPNARRIGDMIYFDSGVTNERAGYQMYSKVAQYDLKKRVLRGKSDFFIKSAGEDIKGDNIYYDLATGRARADNIAATFVLQKGVK